MDSQAAARQSSMTPAQPPPCERSTESARKHIAGTAPYFPPATTCDPTRIRNRPLGPSTNPHISPPQSPPRAQFPAAAPPPIPGSSHPPPPSPVVPPHPETPPIATIPPS